ncbi:MAG: tetratricopeptide repeat protein [Emticicia sp.]|uniref:type IX secretion system periplasmic lipoprotein PorW/SprE n=1 Tax=Emticicia sp. TaxID=1930953 RepID=UPI003BA50675
MQKLYILIAFSLLAASCSQFSNSPTSKAWHNTNARFNSLIIARDNMKQAEKDLFDKRVENYSALMTIFVPIDSTKSQAVATNLKEVIEKTSLIAERHSNSKYLGEAYILLGKARLLKEDYLNAIEIFKYINSTESKEEDKHAALVWLMRAYTEQKDYDTALKVSDVLRTLDLNKENTRDFYLTKAYLHQRREEFAISAAIGEEALKLMSRNEQTARVHFAVGQMFDMIGQPAKALPHFAAVAKNRPNYDMEFYARMNTLLDEAASQRGSTAGVQDNFKKMLVDRKNSDLKDKIYFTMGSLEMKKQNYPKAIEYFNSSLRSSKGNSTQDAYTYLELAELYYNHLNKYDVASMYYDSTLTALPKTSTDYERIAKRAISLGDFVKYQKVLIVEDSLQQLAAMNPAALDKSLERIIKQKEEDDRLMQEMAQKIVSQNSLPVERLSDKDPEFKRWALYDPLVIARNKSDFQQVWGSRPLDDNWRRKDKEAGSISFKVERGVVGQEPTKQAPKQSPEELKKLREEKEALALEGKKKELYEKIPTTPEKLVASKRKQEEALYQLGKIYKFQFNEPQNATETFLTLLNKFPNTVHEVEVLYLLTLLSDNQATSPYRKTLIDKFPASTYARQLLRGKVEITSDTESKANVVYSQAFNLYVNESYESAMKLAEDGLITYTGTSIEDKFAMLRIFLFAKLEQKDAYKQALNEFIQGYPSSGLMPRAKELMAVFDKK